MTIYGTTAKPRIDWVDYAKGICIVLVVMMHATLGVEAALDVKGYLSTFIEWARPFRMPDFFLISGLFLARRIDVPWRDFLDKKVVHFLYFYVLWMSLQFLFKGYGIWQVAGAEGLAHHWLLAFVEPFSTLWFIYLLPVCFMATRLTRKLPPLLVFAAAAALEIAPVQTGWIMPDEFAARFVYFFAGYWLAAQVFRFAHHMQGLTTAGLVAALASWGIVHTQAFRVGLTGLPVADLAFGFLGVAAVVSAAVLFSRFKAGEALRFLGENSIVVYLSFFIFMAGSRTVAVWLAPELGPDALSLGVTLAGILGPVILFFATRRTALKYLFRRPDWATLESCGQLWQTARHDQLNPRPQAR